MVPSWEVGKTWDHTMNHGLAVSLTALGQDLTTQSQTQAIPTSFVDLDLSPLLSTTHVEKDSTGMIRLNDSPNQAILMTFVNS